MCPKSLKIIVREVLMRVLSKFCSLFKLSLFTINVIMWSLKTVQKISHTKAQYCISLNTIEICRKMNDE